MQFEKRWVGWWGEGRALGEADNTEAFIYKFSFICPDQVARFQLVRTEKKKSINIDLSAAIMSDLRAGERWRSPDTRVVPLPCPCCTWQFASCPEGTTVALPTRHPPRSRRDMRPWPLTRLTSLPLLSDDRPDIWKWGVTEPVAYHCPWFMDDGLMFEQPHSYQNDAASLWTEEPDIETDPAEVPLLHAEEHPLASGNPHPIPPPPCRQSATSGETGDEGTSGFAI